MKTRRQMLELIHQTENLWRLLFQEDGINFEIFQFEAKFKHIPTYVSNSVGITVAIFQWHVISSFSFETTEFRYMYNSFLKRKCNYRVRRWIYSFLINFVPVTNKNINSKPFYLRSYIVTLKDHFEKCIRCALRISNQNIFNITKSHFSVGHHNNTVTRH